MNWGGFPRSDRIVFPYPSWRCQVNLRVNRQEMGPRARIPHSALCVEGVSGDSSPRPGQDFEFAYDATGNPLFQDRNGFLLTNTFNELNQNVTSLWGGAMSVIGAINTQEADVTVNGSDAVVLDDMTFVATNLAISGGTNLFTAVVTDPFDRKATNSSEVGKGEKGSAKESCCYASLFPLLLLLFLHATTFANRI